MVKTASGFGHNGLQAWLIQRITAAILALYLIYICVYVIITNGMDYETWYFLQTNPGMKVVNTVVLISLIYHALIGIWTVITDYIKITWLKMLAEIIANLSLLACFLYGLYTLLVVI